MHVEKWVDSDHRRSASKILRAALQQLGESEDEISIALDLAELEGNLAFIAASQRRVLGVLIATSEPWNRAAFVRWIVVAPDARRRGAGTALVEALAATPGLEQITGMVDQTDPAALAFWKGQGWGVRKPRPGRRRELMGVELAEVRPEAA